MRMFPILLAAFVAILGPAASPAPAAQTARAAPVAEKDMDALFADLAAARTQAEGRAAEDAIWRRWIVGPDAEATALLAEAMRLARGYDLEGATMLLDDLTAAYPDWAEPWNQRAFVLFLRDRPDEALEDIDRALELEPRHFGALSGRAIILLGMGRVAPARKALREATAIHPWLKERGLLGPAPAPTPAEDL